MTDRDRKGEPSTAEGEIAEPDPIAEDKRVDRDTAPAINGSEGGGGDNTPSHPHERKRRS